MHKNIDDSMKCAEFYSPLGFLRLLLKVDRIHPYKVIQMSQKDFKDYANCAKMLKYNTIPFTKVFQLKFVRSDLFIVQFKLLLLPLVIIETVVSRSNEMEKQRHFITPCAENRERTRQEKDDTPAGNAQIYATY